MLSKQYQAGFVVAVRMSANTKERGGIPVKS